MSTELAHPCVEHVSHSNVTVSEKGKSVNFKNIANDDFYKVRVDGCLVKTGPRADWIVTKVGCRSVIVELKGKDVEHACEQVFATASHSDCIKWLEKPTRLLIICAQSPSFNTRIARHVLKARKLGLSLKIVTRHLSCDIEVV